MYGRTDVDLISAVGSLLDAKLQGVCQQIAAPDWSLNYFLANHSVSFSEIFAFYFLFLSALCFLVFRCCFLKTAYLLFANLAYSRNFSMYIIKYLIILRK